MAVRLRGCFSGAQFVRRFFLSAKPEDAGAGTGASPG
jgi:hypothetical protein